MKDATLLYGVKIGDEDWQEIILSSRPETFDRVKELATKDGYDRFRVAHFRANEKPNFIKAINR